MPSTTETFAAIFIICFIPVPYIIQKINLNAFSAFHGPKISPALGWFIMESPNLVFPIVHILYADWIEVGWYNFLLLSMFLFHYVQRTVIYPLRMQHQGQMSVWIILLGLCFTVVNAYLQTIGIYETKFMEEDLGIGLLGFGCAVFLYGFYVNYQSDAILLRLRKEFHGNKVVPTGGWFKYVSCAHYFGEMLEWVGYAIAGQGSLFCVAFAVNTALNIGPRGLLKHEEYKKKFDDYPKDRKAIIPFLL